MNALSEPVLMDAEVLRDFTERVFDRFGVPPEDAKIAAEVLIEADLRGFDCHGVARLFPCFNRIRKGLIEVNPNITIEWLTKTTGHCDWKWAWNGSRLARHESLSFAGRRIRSGLSRR